MTYNDITSFVTRAERRSPLLSARGVVRSSRTARMSACVYIARAYNICTSNVQYTCHTFDYCKMPQTYRR